MQQSKVEGSIIKWHCQEYILILFLIKKRRRKKRKLILKSFKKYTNGVGDYNETLSNGYIRIHSSIQYIKEETGTKLYLNDIIEMRKQKTLLFRFKTNEDPLITKHFNYEYLK